LREILLFEHSGKTAALDDREGVACRQLRGQHIAECAPGAALQRHRSRFILKLEHREYRFGLRREARG